MLAPAPHLTDQARTTWNFFVTAQDELKRLASLAISREWISISLQRTALLHETFLRMLGDRQIRWENRADFFAAASNQMKQIVIEHARRRKAQKRWGGLTRVTLDDAAVIESRLERMVHLDEVLKNLAEIDGRAARVVEMRVFGGLTNREIGTILGIGEKTVERDWAFARAWLRRALSD
jgi:RNA polymerase sigma factor (TIGR02999 family)